MELDRLAEILDERGIGDPAVVEALDIAVPEFREQVFGAEEDDASLIYAVGIAAFFSDVSAAYELLNAMRPAIEKQGPARMKELYEEQLRVWRARRNKDEHDMQYLRIVLGVKQALPEED